MVLNMDVLTDSSVHRFVWPNNSLANVSYIPDELVRLEYSEHLYPSRYPMYLRADAAAALNAMAQWLYATYGEPLTVVSAYRSYGDQQRINRNHWADLYRAKAWHSEHQLGLAVDLMWLNNDIIAWNQQTKTTYQWLVENAHSYGFTQSYQKGHEIDGYHVETRHWRFVGVWVAEHLKNNNLTFTEFFSQQ
jgi:D-alanyl-D-alanine carboxypeptidase